MRAEQAQFSGCTSTLRFVGSQQASSFEGLSSLPAFLPAAPIDRFAVVRPRFIIAQVLKRTESWGLLVTLCLRFLFPYFC
jgi:hypothetical protein